MRGIYLLLGSVAGFAAGNYAIHLHGGETASVFLRKIPPGLMCAALAAGGAVLVDHLYGKH